MTKGRKATPTKLKVVSGNPGKRAINKDEPKPSNELGECPPWATQGARDQWDYVVQLLGEVPGVSKKPDEAAALLLAEAIAEFVEAAEVLSEDGHYQDVTTKAGDVMTRAHPAIGVKQKAFAQIQSLCSEFGLTPSSRTRLKADLEDGDEDPAEKYFSRRDKA